ncbi:MAG: LacI family DNA-binding transcriptional regulator [Armatimonadetes bacterium]|nr:LacI family DNA-binding transcriptional regulator [Armatimonadota bacterium]
MQKEKPTLEDVGREAGVSPATVSYVISNSKHADRISPETKRRVLAAAKSLGYSGNSLAIALKRGYTDTVVLLAVTWTLASAQAEMTTSITRAAARKGLHTIVHVASEDQEALTFLEDIPSLKPFGLLLQWDSDNFPEGRLQDLAATGLPIVDLLPSGTDDIVSVTADREQGFRLVTEHLLSLGHERIAVLVETTKRWRSSSRKLAGYRAALSQAGIDYDGGIIEEIGSAEFENGYEGIKSLLARRPDVTAVIGMNDYIAIGAIAAAQDMGIRVPRELSVAGYGAHREGIYIRPTLTSVAVPFPGITETAVDTLVQMRKDARFKPKSICKPMELIIRDSTGCSRLKVEC